MKSIDISITKARIKNVMIWYKPDSVLPRVNAGIELLTANGEPITTYDIDTESYDKNKKFDLPIGLVDPIKKMLLELEDVVTKHCNERMKLLEEVKTEE